MSATPRPFDDAQLVLGLFAMAPTYFGGVRVRSWASEPRRSWLEALEGALPPGMPVVQLPAGADDGQLLGQAELGTAADSQLVSLSQGLLARAHGGVLLVRMAERLPTSQAAMLCAALDDGRVRIERDGMSAIAPATFGCIALDEGVVGEEAMGQALQDRLAFAIDLHDVAISELAAQRGFLPRATIAEGSARLCQVQVADALLPALCRAALKLNIASLRAPRWAERAARGLAALDGESQVSERHAELAVRLVYGPRAQPAAEPDSAATTEPQPAPETPEPDRADQASATQASPPDSGPEQSGDSEQDDLSEQLVAAVPVAWAEAQLASLSFDRRRRRGEGPSGRFGPPRESRRRGAPLTSRPDVLKPGDKLDIPATLRRAAPWQPLRRQAAAKSDEGRLRPLLNQNDLCPRRYRQHTPMVTLFLVDASGSAARARLAEAKGAVEELLGECYVRRDQVGLLAFRGAEAQLLLPPTRSLVRAKRALAGLAGGGGTPLALGLKAALVQTQRIARSGAVPVLVLLTDGRPNVDLQGRGGREQAIFDARAMARALGHTDCASLTVDCSVRGQPFAAELAGLLRGEYQMLPRSGERSLGQYLAARNRTHREALSASREAR